MVDFGKNLKRLRLQSGMTQQQLATQIGVTKSVVSYYELQERYPSPEVLMKLSVVFHVSTDYLLGATRGELLDLSGLEEEDILLVKQMVGALRKKNQKESV